MNLEKESLNALTHSLKVLQRGFNKLPSLKSTYDTDEIRKVLDQVAQKMQDNYPYFHPLFAGQMLKPPHPIAKAAYMLSLWINPNNHALDGSKASSPMEKEVVADLANLFDWKNHLGHLTGGGTMANLEALWVADKTHPAKTIVASDLAHYTHERISGVLNIHFEKIATNAKGQMDIPSLESRLKSGDIGTVVCTMGTTGTGAVDPLDELIELQQRYSFRIHADAAYGGYFRLLDNLGPEATKNYQMLSQVDSIVIDPHKHGLQPYGCGCVLFSDREVAKYYLHDSPYTYYTSDELHLGEISLECSRPGAAAVGLWATHQLLPPVKGGAFAAELSKCRMAAVNLYERLNDHPNFHPVMYPETDIVVWVIKDENTHKMSEKAALLFKMAEANQLYLSLYKHPADKLSDTNFEINSEYVTCLRSCLMKPEHDDWLDEIWGRLVLTLDQINNQT